MTDWRLVALGDVVDIFDHKRVPLSSAQRSTRKGPYPYYGAQGVIDSIDDFIFDGRFILVPEDGENLRSRKLPIAYFAEGQFWVNNHAHIIKAKPGIAVDRYIQSALQAMDIGPYITGAAQPKLSQSNLRRIPLSLPSVEYQQTVAATLDCFDELIENNRRRVEVLEEMARVVYREWFVHLRYPGHEDAVLVDSPFGPIPEAWALRTVLELSASLTRGIAPKYAENGQWIVLNQKCIRDERVSFGTARRQERSVPGNKQVQFGDVLINSTGVGTLGRVAMLLADHDALTADSHVTIVRPLDTKMNPWFGMNLVALRPEFESLGTGSTGQTELSRHDIGARVVACPPENILEQFARVVWPLLIAAPALLKENRRLSSMRDLVLPKLLTGQIDVSSLNLHALAEERAAG